MSAAGCKFFTPWILALLLSGCEQGYEHPVIGGLCNFYLESHLTQIINKGPDHDKWWLAHTTQQCSARPQQNCSTNARDPSIRDKENYVIPEAESQADLDAGKRWLVDGNNGRTFCIWRMTRDKMIRGADSCNFSNRLDMAESNPDQMWYVVLDERFHVALSLNNCAGPPPSFPCSAKSVKGYWRYRYTIPTDNTETWKHGSLKKYQDSKTEEWSDSVTIKVELGFEIEGFDLGFSVGPTLGHKFAETYSQEWSVSEEYDFTFRWSGQDVGKASWQFVVDTLDTCGHKERALLQEFAVTPNREREPCCLPGYGVDMPYYTRCVSKEYLMPNAEKHGCTADSRTQEVIQVV